MDWQFLSILIVLVFLLFQTIMNRTAGRRCGEDIDEIRSTLFELRRSARARQAEMNRKLAEIRVQMLKNHDRIPAGRFPYTITADCISCGTCVPECPVQAIIEGEIYEIDPEKCIACNKCAEVCPVHACKPMSEPGSTQ